MEQRILLAATRPDLEIQDLDSIPITGRTEHKPQSKLWTHHDEWWTVIPDSDGTHVWRLDEQTLSWSRELTLSNEAFRADVKSVGNLVHVLLFPDGPDSQLATLEYGAGTGGAPGEYRLWSQRPNLVDITLGGSVESATLDIDSTGRLWIASDDSTTIEVRYSDLSSNYSNWSTPIDVGTGISSDDISVVTALPAGTMLPDGTELVDGGIAVLWSNQSTDRFGFRVHQDGDPPNVWSDDELPASQSALDGGGMADDHVNVAVTSDGTLYAAVKTSYNTSGQPKIGLLVRRPDGTWDDLYVVDTDGTRPIVVVNEVEQHLMVIYADGSIVYRESDSQNIEFGPVQTLMGGRDVTSTKQNWVNELAILAKDRGVFLTTSTSSTPSNQPPVLDFIGDKSVQIDQSLSFSVSATDPEGTALTYTADNVPTGADFGPVTREFNWTPTSAQQGTHDVTFHVFDGTHTVSETITITVGDVSQEPVTVRFQDGVDGYSGTQDTRFKDSSPDKNYGSNTELRLDGDKGYTSLARWDLSGISPGSTVSAASITVNVTGRSSDVYPIYQALQPWLEQEATWNEFAAGQPWGVAGALDVGDRGSTVLGELTAPETGPVTLQLNAAGVAVVQEWINDPASNYGLILQNLEVSDGLQFSSREVANAADRPMLTVELRGGGTPSSNPPPVLDAIGGRVVNEGSLLEFAVSATDPENEPLSYSADDLPAGADFDPVTQVFRWTPTETQDGSYEVTFHASDGQSTDSETINITVNEVNQPPVLAVVGDRSVDEGMLLELTVSATDHDVINGAPDALSYSVDGLPSGATLNNSNGLFQWTPTESQDGDHVVTFHVSDGDATSSETITITVNEVNQPPALSPVGDKSVRIDQSLSFTVSATDPEGTALTYTADNVPTGADFDPVTREFNWTPTSAQLGTHDVTFHVSDGTHTVSETITITVSDVSQAPVIVSFQDGVDGYSGTQDTRFKSSRPDRNYGSNTELRLDGDKGYTSLARWDLSSIPAGTTVSAASITVNVTGRSSAVYPIYQSLEPWLEAEATWNEYAAGQPWNVAGAQGSGDRGSTVLGELTAPETGPVTLQLNAAGVAVVQEWINDPASNYGLILQNLEVSDGLQFSSREAANAADRPMLTVSYVTSGDAGGLTAASSPGPATSPDSLTDSLTGEELSSIVDAAAASWLAALNVPGSVDVSAVLKEEGALLKNVTVQIGDLPGQWLGQAAGTAITIDHNAAGLGWFVDPSPEENSEFAGPAGRGGLVAITGSSAFDRIDLLSVVAHELGHVLGYEHSRGDDVMNGQLSTATRRLPDSGDSVDSAGIDRLFEEIGLAYERPGLLLFT